MTYPNNECDNPPTEDFRRSPPDVKSAYSSNTTAAKKSHRFFANTNKPPQQLTLFEDTSPLLFKKMTDPPFVKLPLENREKQDFVLPRGKESENSWK